MSNTKKKTFFLIAALVAASLLCLAAYRISKNRTRVFVYTDRDMIRSEALRLAFALEEYFSDFKPGMDVESLNSMSDEQVAELLGDAAFKSEGLVDFKVLDGGKRRVVLDPNEQMYRIRVKPIGQWISDGLLWKQYRIYFWSSTPAETISQDQPSWRRFGPYEMNVTMSTNVSGQMNR
ncbi:MAG TPA: hypothetical protein VK968_01905 [Roseimicrobium sp.]|nr:hypothetical protein [Roseimicrobium sp.]